VSHRRDKADLAKKLGGTSPTGTTPNQILHAYGIDQIKFGSVVGDG
jgi:hypothetical protein